MGPTLLVMRFSLVFLCIAYCSSALATDEIIPTSQVGLTCPEIVDAALYKLDPAFAAKRMNHRFANAFQFSADGSFATIRHYSYPDTETVTLRSLGNGAVVTAFAWQGQVGNLHSISSVAFDGERKQVIGLTVNTFSDGSDVVAIWDGQSGSLQERVVIPAVAHFKKVSTRSGMHYLHTDISLAHPYYIRSRLRSVSSGGGVPARELGVQIVDWKRKGILQLEDASPDFLGRIRDPFSPKFRYAAILKKDQSTIQIQSFGKIDSQLQTAENPIRAKLQGFTRGILGEPGTGEFSAHLRHSEEVIEGLLSESLPLLVTHTASGLHVWDTKQGKLLFEISQPGIARFRLIDRLGILAFTDSHKNLTLYSIEDQKRIKVLEGFEPYAIHTHLNTYNDHSAFIYLKDGAVFELAKASPIGANKINFDLIATGIHLNSRNNSLQTSVQTSKGKYFIHCYSSVENSRAYQLDVYSLIGDGQPLQSMMYSTSAFHSQIALDPTGQKILYTLDEESSGLISLPHLLEELGL